MKQTSSCCFLLLLLSAATTLAAEPAASTNKLPVAFTEAKSSYWTPGYTDMEKSALLAIAKDTIALQAGTRTKPFTFNDYELTERIKSKAGVLVELALPEKSPHRAGSIMPDSPLHEAVHKRAKAVWARVKRDESIEPKNINKAQLSIVLTSSPQLTRSLKGFKTGNHGIMIQKGPIQAFCLPHEPVENNWSIEEMMDALIAKTRFPKGSWQRATYYYFFTTVTLTEIPSPQTPKHPNTHEKTPKYPNTQIPE